MNYGRRNEGGEKLLNGIENKCGWKKTGVRRRGNEKNK